MKNKLLILGTGGHCRSIIDNIESNDFYDVVGIVDITKDKKFQINDLVNGYKIVGYLEDLNDIIIDWDECIIAVGDNYKRELVYLQIIKQLPLVCFARCIHKNAIISKDVEIGQGSVIMAGVVINTYSKIGEHVLINTNSTIEHDNIIKDFATVAPGVTLGGTVSIGTHSVVSIGSTVLHNITIKDDTVVGAHSLVNKNIESNAVAYGVPAKIIRKRIRGERYL